MSASYDVSNIVIEKYTDYVIFIEQYKVSNTQNMCCVLIWETNSIPVNLSVYYDLFDTDRREMYAAMAQHNLCTDILLYKVNLLWHHLIGIVSVLLKDKWFCVNAKMQRYVSLCQLPSEAHSNRQVHLDNFSWLRRPCWEVAKFWIRFQKFLKLMPSPSFTPICFSTSPK